MNVKKKHNRDVLVSGSCVVFVSLFINMKLYIVLRRLCFVLITRFEAYRLSVSPSFGSGGTHLLAGEGVGGSNSDEGTDTVNTLGICVLCGLSLQGKG
jgi:hypothetical protein